MDASELRAWCLQQTGASEDFPFGPEHSVFKVDGKLPDQLVRDLIEDSYDLVVSGLPKRVRERLAWAPQTDL